MTLRGLIHGHGKAMKNLAEARAATRIELRIEELEAALADTWPGTPPALMVSERIAEARHILAILRTLEGGAD